MMELEGRGERPVFVHAIERELGGAVVVRAERVAIGDVRGTDGLGRDRAAQVGAIEKTEHAQSVRTSRSRVPITPSQGCGGE